MLEDALNHGWKTSHQAFKETFIKFYYINNANVHIERIYENASYERFKSFAPLPVLYVFIIITCDSFLMFIYSRKHVRQA